MTKLSGYSTIIMIAAFLTVPRSHVELKLAAIVAFLIMHMLVLVLRGRIRVPLELTAFYVIVCTLGVFWSLRGHVNGGEIAGILDALRLYVGWSVAYFVIILMILNCDEIQTVHKAMVLSAILISVVNFLGLIDSYFQLGIFSDTVRQQLDMYVGYHAGYIQMTTQNIGSLFFVIPYLLALTTFKKHIGVSPNLVRLSLVLTLIVAAISGRRALWLALLVLPLLVNCTSLYGAFFSRIKGVWRFAFGIQLVGIALLLILALFWIDSALFQIDTVQYVLRAFSQQDERTIQKSFLLEGVLDYPLLGSGFGVGVDYIRNEERPWLYELTYHQLLFNFGALGVVVILGCFFFYFHKAVKSIKAAQDGIMFGLLIGVLAFSVGAYSNPYFGSFDFLLVIAMLPYLASLRVERKDNREGSTRKM